MLIICPNCRNRFDVPPAGTPQERRLRCSNCRAVFRLVPRAEPPPPGTIGVVIANESAPFCEAVQKVLAGEPFRTYLCNDGREALATVERVRPQLLLLDVALPGMFGFEVCERVRQNPALSGVKIVLIASIYDKTRYKRAPKSLYGADDYIEKHHIPDSLIPMIYGLVSGKLPQVQAPSARELAVQEEARCAIRAFEVKETSSAPLTPTGAALPAGALGVAAASAPAAGLGELELKARRLARIIVSDIVLYNQNLVERGVRDGSFFELLADDIREGELLYRQRVPAEVREGTSFLDDAYRELIAKKRAEMRI